jgi:hypothetical protein
LAGLPWTSKLGGQPELVAARQEGMAQPELAVARPKGRTPPELVVALPEGRGAARARCHVAGGEEGRQRRSVEGDGVGRSSVRAWRGGNNRANRIGAELLGQHVLGLVGGLGLVGEFWCPNKFGFRSAKRRFLITSKCRQMHGVLNIDEIKN